MIIEMIKNYLQLKFEAIIEKDIEKISAFSAVLVGITFLMICFLLSFLFSTFALALFISKYVGENYWGFLIISGFYLFVGYMFWIFKNSLIKKPLSKTLNKGFKDSFINQHEQATNNE
jgi:hypothetical protein